MKLPGILQKLIPSTVGGKCIAALIGGWVFAFLLPQLSPYVLPLGIIFVRISTIVVLPYIVLELVCSLGGLSKQGIQLFLKSGSLIIGSAILIATAVGMFVPTLLPNMSTSSFFAPELLEVDSTKDLYNLFLPDNIFKALSESNFPAIVLASIVVGLVIQSTEKKSILLDPLEQLLGVFRRLNGFIAKIVPIGIFAMSAQSANQVGWESLVKMHALLLVSLCGAIILVIMLLGLISSVTPYKLRDLLRAVEAPVAITASSGGLMIAFPAITESIRTLLAKYKQKPEEDIDRLTDQLATSLPIGYVLPNVGQVFMISIIPYMAWFIDRPMNLLNQFYLYATHIPTTTGGLSLTLRAAVKDVHLPYDVLNIYIINSEWIARLEKSLAVIGFLFVALTIGAVYTKSLALKPRMLVGTLMCCALVVVASSWAVPMYLSRALANTYTNDLLVHQLRPFMASLKNSTETPEITSLEDSAMSAMPSLPVTLDSIRNRGYLRVGVYTAGLPWISRDSIQTLRGYDIDMIQALAQALDVEIRYTAASIDVLKELIRSSKIDIAVGGLPDNTIIEFGMNVSHGYQLTHGALLVQDDHYWALDQASEGKLGRPLVIASSSKIDVSTAMRQAISRALPDGDGFVPIRMVKLASVQEFLSHHEQRGIDAYLTTAESGAILALLHPSFTMYPAFGRKLPTMKVMITGGSDRAFEEFVDVWISLEKQRGLFDKLYKHWIQVRTPH